MTSMMSKRVLGPGQISTEFKHTTNILQVISMGSAHFFEILTPIKFMLNEATYIARKMSNQVQGVVVHSSF